MYKIQVNVDERTLEFIESAPEHWRNPEEVFIQLSQAEDRVLVLLFPMFYSLSPEEYAISNSLQPGASS